MLDLKGKQDTPEAAAALDQLLLLVNFMFPLYSPTLYMCSLSQAQSHMCSTHAKRRPSTYLQSGHSCTASTVNPSSS